MNKIDRGLAFIVGINEYDHAKKLKNAVYDAESISATLKELGFSVIDLYDTTRREFITKRTEFCNKLKNYSVGIFYFAGHGVEINKSNYLLLKDTLTNSEADITYWSFPLQDIINDMAKSNCKMNIHIIDACRDNPWENERGIATLNLAPIIAPRGTLIAYSTSSGQTAKDGGFGKNSIYTGAILSHIKTKNLPIEEFFKRVRTTVFNLSEGQQVSWEHTSLIGTFSFNSSFVKHSILEEYPDDVINLSLLPTDSHIFEMKEEFLSGTFALQEKALDEFKRTDYKSFTRDELFTIGRCIMQAAVWNCFACQRYLKDMRNIQTYYINEENNLLDGILYGLYFDIEGKYHLNVYQKEFFPEIMKFCNKKGFSCSFQFINKALEPFKDRLIFVPSENPTSVSIDLILDDCEFKNFVGMKVKGPHIKSIKYENRELYDESGNDFFLCGHNSTVDDVIYYIEEKYCIPPIYLNIVCNHPEYNGNIILFGGLVEL